VVGLPLISLTKEEVKVESKLLEELEGLEDRDVGRVEEDRRGEEEGGEEEEGDEVVRVVENNVVPVADEGEKELVDGERVEVGSLWEWNG
jgi:hypothetical protein